MSESIEAAARVIDPLAFAEQGSCPPRGYECHTPEQLSRTIAARRHAIRVAERVVAAYLQHQWRPIAEAPKDGKPFLAGWWSDTYWQCEKVHWANGPVYEGDNGIDGLIEVPATHWQPLPEPPKEQG